MLYLFGLNSVAIAVKPASFRHIIFTTLHHTTVNAAIITVITGSVRSDVFTVVLVKIQILWDVMLCNWDEYCPMFQRVVVSSSSAPSVTLTIKALQSFRTSGTTCPVTQSYIPEDLFQLGMSLLEALIFSVTFYRDIFLKLHMYLRFKPDPVL
jgi:hypothetical protein